MTCDVCPKVIVLFSNEQKFAISFQNSFSGHNLALKVDNSLGCVIQEESKEGLKPFLLLISLLCSSGLYEEVTDMPAYGGVFLGQGCLQHLCSLLTFVSSFTQGQVAELQLLNK